MFKNFLILKKANWSESLSHFEYQICDSYLASYYGSYLEESKMNLLSRSERTSLGQEINWLELEFISYDIQGLSLKGYIIYISYISVDCFFSRSVLIWKRVRLHHSIINILTHCCHCCLQSNINYRHNFILRSYDLYATTMSMIIYLFVCG